MTAIQKLLSVIISLIPLVSFSQGLTVRSLNGQATNLTLTGSLSVGAVTNPPFVLSGYADTFARLSGVTDKAVIDDLRGFEAELQEAGILSNLVDAVFFGSRFNPTNYKTFFGNAWTSNQNAPVYDGFGANFYLTNGVTITLPSSVTSNTVVIVYRTPARAFDSSGDLTTYQNFNFSLQNAADTNGFYMGFDPSSGYRLWERGGAVWAYGGSTTTAGNSNKLRMLKNVGYGNDPVYMINRNVFALSSDGSGKHKLWMNTVQMLFNQDSFVTNYTSPVTNSSVLNTVKLGLNPTWTSFLFNGSFSNRNFIGAVAAILVFNKDNDTNIVNGSYSAGRWLDQSATETIYHGASIMDVPLIGGNGFTNSPAWIVQSRDTFNQSWQYYAYGGATITNMTNGLLWGRFPVTPVSMLPKGKVTKIEIVTDMGRNDILLSGRLPSNTYADFGSLYAPYKALGAEVTFIATHEVHPSASGYNAANNSNLTLWCTMMMTNPAITRYIPEREYVGQSTLANTRKSRDFIHLDGPDAYVINGQLANLIMGLPWGPGEERLFTLVTNNFISGMIYTNTAQVSWVQCSVDLVGAAAGTANMTLYIDNSGQGNFLVGQTNICVSAGPLAALATTEVLGAWLQPFAAFSFTNLTSGAAATVAIRDSSSQWMRLP